MGDNEPKTNYPMSFRFDSETHSLLDALKAKFHISKAAVIRIAIRKLHESELTDIAE
jgi:predicted transcriptional regulator